MVINFIIMSHKMPDPEAKPTLPYAPTPTPGGYANIPQTEAERNSGLFSKLRWGQIAIAGAVAEVPSAVAAVATHEPSLLLGGPLVVAYLGGHALHEAHNYFRNGSRPTFPINRFIKAKTLER